MTLGVRFYVEIIRENLLRPVKLKHVIRLGRFKFV